MYDPSCVSFTKLLDGITITTREFYIMKALSCWHMTTFLSSNAFAHPRPSEALGNCHPEIDLGTR